MTLHYPLGSLAAGPDPVSLTAEQAGWTYTGLDVIDLGARATAIVRDR